MKIEEVVWLRPVVDKLARKHQVDPHEVEEVFEDRPKIRFVEKGQRKDENVYMALGQTTNGRYLTVLFIYKPSSKQSLILSARDMTTNERRQYAKK